MEVAMTRSLNTLSWRSGGILLGLVFFAAVMLVKPIGVSTQFVIFDGIVWNAVDPSVVVPSETAKSGFASPNAYLNKSGGSYAKSVANPWNYSFVFVVAMVVVMNGSGHTPQCHAEQPRIPSPYQS